MKDYKNAMEALEMLLGKDLAVRFDSIAKANGASTDTVLKSFLLDYIVSGGHPEQVGDGDHPWSRSRSQCSTFHQ